PMIWRAPPWLNSARPSRSSTETTRARGRRPLVANLRDVLDMNGPRLNGPANHPIQHSLSHPAPPGLTLSEILRGRSLVASSADPPSQGLPLPSAGLAKRPESHAVRPTLSFSDPLEDASDQPIGQIVAGAKGLG